MPETLTSDEFEHAHNDSMNRLENQKLKLESTKTPNLRPLDDELSKILNEIFMEIPRTDRLDPQEVFRKAIQCLPKVDRGRMLIDNLLESLKRGDKLPDIVKRYRDLGLLTASDESKANNTAIAGLADLVERRGIWKRVGTSVIRIAVNAFKSIPKWAEIEPSIMFVGPVPAIGFTLKGKGMSIQDLFEVLIEDPKASG